MAKENESPFSPAQGEIGVYLGHFVTWQRFSLEPNLLEILKFYGVPLCLYNPCFIGCMISFHSLLRLKELPFSVDSFRTLLYIRETHDVGFKCWNPC